MLLAAKEEMFSTCSDPCVSFSLAAFEGIGENSRLGSATRKTALHRGRAWSNSARALGIEEVLLGSRVGCRSSGNTSGGPSLWTVSKNLNRCAAQLAQTKSVSALSNGRIPEVLGSNFFSDISTLATGGGGLDQGAGIAVEGTIQVAEHAGAQVAVGTVTTISTPISAAAGVYNPVAVGTASQSLGGTVVGRVGLGFLKAASIAKVGWDAAMYLAAEAACAAPAFQ
jgi:hypothetical protein